MAEVMSGNDLTVVVLQPDETVALCDLLRSAVENGIEVRNVLVDLFNALDVEADYNPDEID